MLRNYYILNTLLGSVAILLGMQLYAILSTPLEIPSEAPHTDSAEIEKKDGGSAAPEMRTSYDVIASENLFHPSRSVIKEPQTVSVQISKSDLPQLFGTVILKNKKMAILEDRATKKSGPYEVNESVSGFLIAKILENKVILERNGESVEVRLRTDKKLESRRNTALRKAPKKRRRPRRVRRRRPRTRQPRTAGSGQR